MRKTTIALVAFICAMIASSVVSANINQFAGKWENIDSKTRGLTRLEIAVEGTKVKVHAYGSCVPKDCDWREVEAVAYAPSVCFKLAETAQVLTAPYGNTIMIIRPVEGDRLQVETFTKFTDGSGRAAYRAVYTFARSGLTAEK